MITTENQAARKIRVYYEGSSTLYTGSPVCYNFDTTDNWFGFGPATLAAAGTIQGTTAEGEQNEGKYIRVEDVSTTNQMHFAGVVAEESNGQAGAGAISIYVPNGAIVPVRADIECVVGVTILCLEDESTALTQLYSANYTSRPVAIAMETNATLDTAPGIVLAKLDPSLFICQDLSAAALSIAPSGAASSALNRINVTTAATSGEMAAFEVKMNCTGGINSPWGLAAYFRAKQSGAMTDRACAVGVTMAMESGGSSVSDLLAALRVKLVCNTGSTVSSLFSMHVLELEADIDVTAPTRFSWIHCASIGTNAPNFFIDALDAGDLGDWAETDHITTSATGDRIIPVRIGDNTYHLVAYANDGLT